MQNRLSETVTAVPIGRLHLQAGQGALTPEMADILARMLSVTSKGPDFQTIPVHEARAHYAHAQSFWNEGSQSLCTVQRLSIPSHSHMIYGVRIDPLPNSLSLGTILYLHGGGWVFGSTRTHHGAMVQLCLATGMTVIGIDYRLAPEAPFPAGLDDTFTAWNWMKAQAPVLKLKGPWIIAGDSAGANIALANLLQLRDRGLPLSDAALLFYGVYTAEEMSESHSICGNGRFGLSSERMAWFRRHYLGGTPENALSEKVAPLLADLRGLPPLFITAAEFDVLHDDSVELARAAEAADVPTVFKRYCGVIHGFMQMSRTLPEAKIAIRDAGDFARKFI